MTEAPLPLSWDEALEEIRALIADRTLTERQRRAFEVLLRYAQRGRHKSVGDADSSQHFTRVRAILRDAAVEMDAGLNKLGPVPPAEEDR